MAKSSIVNVRMVITEEKILSNIEKIQKLINPKSKKQIVQFEEDVAFKDLVQSIKDYLLEYPNKKNFPADVYNAAYGLVEYATKQFENATKQIEELIIKREENIALAAKLKQSLEMVQKKETGWKDKLQKNSEDFSQEIVDTLGLIGRTRSKKSQNYQDATKLVETKIANLESNMFIEIDIERIEDRSKALSYIGIEIAEALKDIPAPVKNIEETENEQQQSEHEKYMEETRINVKPSLWQKFKNTKVIRAIRYVMKVKVVLEFPALPEGTENN